MKPSPGQVFGGRHRYGVVSAIGEGATGCVYLARNLDMGGASRALKVLKDHAYARRFALEAETLARLRHDHIVPMYEYFHDRGSDVIAMAFIDGESLADRIDASGPIPQGEALEIIRPILSALDHAHQLGIIHRDVKSTNILIDSRGKPWLCDFGIARQMGKRGMTAVGVALGTAEYMSPEQISRPKDVDHRTDVYSAGIVLFEMLTGRVPFKQTSDSDVEVLHDHLEREAPAPSALNGAIHRDVDRIVAKALRKQAKKRYQGCGDLLADIDAFQFSRGRSPVAPTGPAPAEPWIGNSRRYNLYEHKTLGLQAVKQGFSWAALFGNVGWMFAKGLRPQAFLWSASYMLLGAAVQALDASGAVLASAGLLVMLVVPGFKGNTWCEAQLAGQGYALKRSVAAPTAAAAVQQGRRQA